MPARPPACLALFLHTPQGVLLQIFTKPLGDRPTVFFEIIQRLCAQPASDAAAEVSCLNRRVQ